MEEKNSLKDIYEGKTWKFKFLSQETIKRIANQRLGNLRKRNKKDTSEQK